MRREGKVGPFIPYEVWAQTGPAWATTPATRRRRRRATTGVGAWAKASLLRQKRLRSRENFCIWAATFGRQHLGSGDNIAARATTSATCIHDSGVNFYKRLHPSDNVCAQAKASTPKRQPLRSGDNVCRVRL